MQEKRKKLFVFPVIGILPFYEGQPYHTQSLLIFILESNFFSRTFLRKNTVT